MPAIEVSVINSDLVHSRYPVVVGHFMGDGIVKAEKFLNLALDSKLSEYHAAGNYPGEIGSHLVIFKEDIDSDENLACQGAVVVGLGEFGTLTENRLIMGLTQAFLGLAIKHNEQVNNRKQKAGSRLPFGISSLLIGSDFAGLRIDTSVKAVLLSVLQANDKLDAMDSREYKKINRVEFVEIYQHKAIQVSRILNKFLQEDRFTHFTFKPPYLKAIPGFLRLIPDEGLQENWNRLEITVKKAGTSGSDNNRTLPIFFTSITDRAHADEQLLPANRLMVDSLIAKMAVYTKWDKSFSQTLYQLLIPNEFKGYGSRLGNLVLIVDEETARYPWELLHDPNGISDKPMAVNTGLVRQLRTPDQRSSIKLNTSNRALVIGNPFTAGKYPDLPAAQQEAENVLKILEANGLELTKCINLEDTGIVPKLLFPSYKIIHIASHGIVGKNINEPTGVVLGSEMVFTAADFNQITIVPEFVFINSCSSNEYDEQTAEKMRRKYDLAANVGTQLIQMGVKAAIVTGWEINDAAAGNFSNEFYNAMFDGKSFGEAVHCAREHTFNNYGKFNTWGAYQCYGDPFYTFRSVVTVPDNHKTLYVDPVEVVYELENLENEVTSALNRSAGKDYKSIVEKIAASLPADWNDNAAILEKFAAVYSALNEFEPAIAYFEKLLNLEDALYSVRSVEQYCNVRVRHAARLFEDAVLSKTAVVKTIREAIDDLKKILGNTTERYSLIAASYRRLFKVDTESVDNLKQSARYYQLAFQHSQKMFNEISYYPYFNWLHLALLLSGPKSKEPYLQIPANQQELDRQALANAEKQDNANTRFFHKTAECSYNLARLLTAKSDQVTKFTNLIETGFRHAWAVNGNLLEKDSFTGYLHFIIHLLEQLPTPGARALKVKKITALKDLVERLSGLKAEG